MARSSTATRLHIASQSGSCAQANMSPYPRCMASVLDGLTDAQRDAVTHRGSPLLVIGGPGSGQAGLRDGIELAREPPQEELAIYSVPEFCISLLSSEARQAGIEPFVDVLGPADRLAMLLDRSPELELPPHH